MKKLFCCSLILLLGCSVAMAVPAEKRWHTYTLPDGTKMELMLTGDEHGHWFKARDGRCYDIQTDITRSGGFEIRPLSDNELQQRKAQAAERRAAANVSRSNLAPSHPRTHAPSMKTPTHYTGERKGLFILVEFPEQPFSRPDIKTVYDSICNYRNYRTPPYCGSVHDYFYEQSDGQFDLTFDIVGPIMAEHNEGYYGTNGSMGGIDGMVQALVIQAVNEVADSVDFTQYDWDGDGEADQVFLLYAGYGEAQGGPSWTIWPCEGRLSKQGGVRDLPVVDGITIDTFACSCELQGKSGTQIDGIGTICHEFTHCLGFPDFYNASDFNDFCMDVFDVMDYGAYNGNTYCPSGYTGYERWYCGWREPVELTEAQHIADWQPLVNEGETFILYNEGNHDEYYLLENRQYVGFDSCLYSHGLVVTHVDYDEYAWEHNQVNTNKNRQRMLLVPADNIRDIKTCDTDAFPYTYLNGRRTLDSLTNRSHPRATVYNKNTDGSYFLNKPIYNIRETGDYAVEFDYLVKPTPPTPTGVVTIDNGQWTIDNGQETIENCESVYDLLGRPVSYGANSICPASRKSIYIRKGRKIIDN